ncbi:hypothetical protein J4423_05185 [Candidatus Pacearchaeota archaeon]|nr:hypothetical protein [Candidatus Pacearchaeota archaeon]
MTFFNIFSNKKIKEKERAKIIVDNREKNSLVISELIKRNQVVEFAQLPVADYIINNIAIERKTINDLKSSIINKRIFSQLNELKQYPNHLLILEGLENTGLYKGQIHENAFRGFLLSVALNFKTPIIYTLNEEDTAKYLSILATKKNKKTEPIRASKTLSSDKEQLQFILEGFPEIGPATTNKLMKEFENLKSIANSSKEQLEKIIGKKAEKIYNLFNLKF